MLKSPIFKLLIGVVIVLLVILSAVKKNRERERQLQEAESSIERIKEEDVLKSYYQMIGIDGFSLSDMAPYGRIMIYGKVFEACSDGEVIEKGDSVEVIGVNGRTLVVKKIESLDLEEAEEVINEEEKSI